MLTPSSNYGGAMKGGWRIGTLVNNMQRVVVSESLPQLPADMKLNDPNDAFLLTMALASEAGKTRIVTPTIFCAEVF